MGVIDNVHRMDSEETEIPMTSGMMLNNNAPYWAHTRRQSLFCDGYTKLDIDKVVVSSSGSSPSFVMDFYDSDGNETYTETFTVGTHTNLEYDITGVHYVYFYNHQSANQSCDFSLYNVVFS